MEPWAGTTVQQLAAAAAASGHRVVPEQEFPFIRAFPVVFKRAFSPSTIIFLHKWVAKQGASEHLESFMNYENFTLHQPFFGRQAELLRWGGGKNFGKQLVLLEVP